MRDEPIRLCYNKTFILQMKRQQAEEVIDGRVKLPQSDVSCLSGPRAWQGHGGQMKLDLAQKSKTGADTH